mgnify:CR=1 FL=1
MPKSLPTCKEDRPPHSHPPICSPLGWQQNLKRLGTKVASGGKDSGYQQSKKLVDAKGDGAAKAP